MRAEVYRNLHTGTWSVRELEGPNKGRVTEHPNFVFMRDARFVVQPMGNARVRAEGRKNVHAFVRGNLMWFSEHGGGGKGPGDERYRKASYNPHEVTTFIDKETGDPLTEQVGRVILDIDSGVWYSEE